MVAAVSSIDAVKTAICRRVYGHAKPTLEIVPERAIKLFETVMEEMAASAAKLPFWEQVATFKAEVLRRTSRSRRGRMAVVYHAYTAAMLRGYLADENGYVRPLDAPNAERVAQAHAYLACSASLD